MSAFCRVSLHFWSGTLVVAESAPVKLVEAVKTKHGRSFSSHPAAPGTGGTSSQNTCTIVPPGLSEMGRPVLRPGWRVTPHVCREVPPLLECDPSLPDTRCPLFEKRLAVPYPPLFIRAALQPSNPPRPPLPIAAGDLKWRSTVLRLQTKKMNVVYPEGEVECVLFVVHIES